MPRRAPKKPERYNPAYEGIATLIRRRLEEKGWGRGEFNVAMGRHRDYTGFALWYRAAGRPTGENLKRAAKVLGVSVDDLKPGANGAAKAMTTPLEALAQSTELVPYKPRAGPTPRPRGDVEASFDFKTKTMHIKFDCRLPIDVGLDVIRLVENSAIRGEEEGTET